MNGGGRSPNLKRLRVHAQKIADQMGSRRKGESQSEENRDLQRPESMKRRSPEPCAEDPIDLIKRHPSAARPHSPSPFKETLERVGGKHAKAQPKTNEKRGIISGKDPIAKKTHSPIANDLALQDENQARNNRSEGESAQSLVIAKDAFTSPRKTEIHWRGP